jgi:hypothetical protein
MNAYCSGELPFRHKHRSRQNGLIDGFKYFFVTCDSLPKIYAFLKFEQRVLQFFLFKFLTEATMSLLPSEIDTVVSGGSVPTFRSILLPHSCRWTIGTSARRNIPEDEIYIEVVLLLCRAGGCPWSTV